jgi:glycosyltransferase involved in cell wall biosynthesis
MIKYSLVVPIYRDGELAEEFCAEFERVFQKLLAKQSIAEEVELIFVNDDASEETAAALRQICERHEYAKLINLSRNFGQHIALSCGYRHASGEYVGTLNVDMEDAPADIPLLLEGLESGRYDIMFGLRKVRRSGLFIRMTSLLFYWILNKATGYDVPLNTATLRIMSRRFVNAYNALTEKSRYIPGLEMWLGFRRGYVEVIHRERTRGRSSYTFGRRLRLAIDAILSFSDLPLRMLVRLGGVVALVGFGLILALMFGKLFVMDFRPGYTSTMSAIVFLGGMQILVIGVASLYIGRILREVQNRPLYVIRDAYKIDPR